MAEQIPNYFDPSETSCPCGCGLDIEEDLRWKLNKVRHKVGIPIYVTSGARCSTHNAKVGGSATSSHKKLIAADLAMPNSERLVDVLKALLEVGIKRIGFNQYRKFIHIDEDEDKPQAIWFYRV